MTIQCGDESELRIASFIMLLAAILQLCSCLLGSQVPLSFCHELEANEEFSDACAAQQRRVESQEKLGRVSKLLIVARRELVDSHRVRKGALVDWCWNPCQSDL